MKVIWDKIKLHTIVQRSSSYRQVIQKLGLIPAGGNYAQVKKYIQLFKIDISHFKGKAWNKGKKGGGVFKYNLEEILIKDSSYQSYKLKNRLFLSGLKKPFCEICGWAKKTKDGRLPLELDHINGDNKDNRIENLRILCPNCHSLQLTHRGRNIKKK